jgi:hypoxanthine phosphoribosyltransferase
MVYPGAKSFYYTDMTNQNTTRDYDRLLAQADLIYDMTAINRALDELATQLIADYADQDPVMLCVMNGSVMTAGHLLPRLPFKLELDYIHATRYGDKTMGGELVWQSQPTMSIKDRHVVLIEDIFDEGLTLAALRDYCDQAGALSVRCVCLLDKQREGKLGKQPEYIGLTVPDRYVFGFGMDVEGYWRNLPAVYAMKDS